ncbi:MAG TPA: hypothetical protein VFH51_01760, partial [Myxococcota bacterium]|nr:hypothetical protein [Myxococcota bacterium]
GDAGATLSIGPGDLVDRESGAPVHGDFNVTMTLWNPAESLTSAPAVLLADSPGAGAPTPLVSFGMAQLELTQNGNRLQVAPGAQLDLHLREPAAAQSAMTRPALRGMPNLYSLDEVSGLWHLEGTVDSGALAYDAATGTFSARLPHLSNWNVDIPADQVALTPTCVQGTVKNSCPAAAGAPLADSNVTVWFMGFEQLKDLHAKSDANGHYCIGDYLSFIGSQGKQNVRYFVSGASYTDTSMFSGGTQNPYPASCFDCEKTGETFDDRGYTYSWCSDCSCNDCMDADTAASGLTSGNAIYYPTTGAGSAVLAGHTSCSQGNCVQLQDVALAGPACAVPGTVPPPADPCQAATAKFLGDTCVPGDVCCSDSGAGGLTCADYLCVPVAEP